MNMQGILIGTAILWVLNLAFVTPLTHFLLGRRMAAEGIEPETLDQLTEEQQTRWRQTATTYYVLFDVIVLGIAGFIGGMLGFWFIGFSTETKGWPGMIAFIAASFAGIAAKA